MVRPHFAGVKDFAALKATVLKATALKATALKAPVAEAGFRPGNLLRVIAPLAGSKTEAKHGCRAIMDSPVWDTPALGAGVEVDSMAVVVGGSHGGGRPEVI